KPFFTHQLFEGDHITGCESDDEVRIRVMFGSLSLACLVKITFKGNSDNPRAQGILSHLSKALPEGHTTCVETFTAQLHKQRDFVLPGEKIHEYTRESNRFSVRRGTGRDKAVREYHKRTERLALWYIEAADSIDLSDDRWEIFLIFQEATSEECYDAALVGYFTVFNFRNPVKGVSFRICQALILPLFQRQGHGTSVLMLLYHLARSREVVWEITVEDPAPGFSKVRNMVDAQVLLYHKVFHEDRLSLTTFQRPGKEELQDACKVTTSPDVGAGKSIQSQPDLFHHQHAHDISMRICFITSSNTCPGFDILKARGIKSSNKEMLKMYRLMVKRRLFKLHQEELSNNSTTRKQQLEEMYREVEIEYMQLARKIVEEV
ncbi:unnamed protein product, partial [Discosporangium mesarthrocarpum]